MSNISSFNPKIEVFTIRTVLEYNHLLVVIDYCPRDWAINKLVDCNDSTCSHENPETKTVREQFRSISSSTGVNVETLTYFILCLFVGSTLILLKSLKFDASALNVS